MLWSSLPLTILVVLVHMRVPNYSPESGWVAAVYWYLAPTTDEAGYFILLRACASCLILHPVVVVLLAVCCCDRRFAVAL